MSVDERGVNNFGFEEEQVFSKKHSNPSEKYKETRKGTSNKIVPKSNKPEPSVHSHQFRKFSSVVSFSCCKSHHRVGHQRTRSDVTNSTISDAFHDANGTNSNPIGSLYHISGSVNSIPDVISSHPILRNTSSNVSHSTAAAEETGIEGVTCILRVKHVRQRFFWDCGIACVMMVLSQGHRQYLTQNLNLIADQEGFQTR